MRPLLIPTINNNDTDARLVAWLKASGDTVCRGDLLATLETTKSVFEFEADSDGILNRTAEAGKSYDFGTTIGYLFDKVEEQQQWLEEQSRKNQDSGSDNYQVTRPAQELIEKHGITPAQLRALGCKIIKAQDLEPIISQQSAASPAGDVSAPSDAMTPNGLQAGIARVVSHSHSTIPVSYFVKRITVDPALAALAKFSAEEKIQVGLPELLVWVISRLASKFPYFFGALHPALRFQHSAAGNIGVTYDFGKGLFIPVVQGAASLGIAEIAKQMMSYKLKAMRGNFKAEDLTGGDISLSLNTETDTDLVLPIILPPQTCFLSLNAVARECRLGTEGQLQENRFVKLAAAFDHRVINGAQAGAFLTAIKTQLENPNASAWSRPTTD